jgi:hypothetical protein
MKTEQFKRASEIQARVIYLAKKRDQLKSIIENGVQNVELKTYSNGHIYFKLHDNENQEDAIAHQPETIDVLLKAFVETSMSMYQREINALEKEFNQL